MWILPKTCRLSYFRKYSDREAYSRRAVSRVHLAAATVVAIAFAAVIGLYAARHDETPARTAFEGAVRPRGIPPARFSLRDQDGRAVTASSLRGRPVIVSFLHTHCRDTCPLIADQVRGALDHLGERARYVAISVDPAGDTSASARAFLFRHALNGRASFLLGTRAQLQPVWRQFGIQPQTRETEHSPSTVILDARGVQRVGFMADQITPEGVAHDMRALLG